MDRWRYCPRPRGSTSSSTGRRKAGSISTQRPHACSSLSSHRGPVVLVCESVMSGFASTSDLRSVNVATLLGARSARSRVAMCSLTLVSSSACRGSFHSPVAESALSAVSISTLAASNGLRSSIPADWTGTPSTGQRGRANPSRAPECERSAWGVCRGRSLRKAHIACAPSRRSHVQADARVSRLRSPRGESTRPRRRGTPPRGPRRCRPPSILLRVLLRHFDVVEGFRQQGLPGHVMAAAT